MNPYEKRIIYEKAIRYYGEEHQIAKATEEIGELLTEIGRYMAGERNWPDLLGELADVKIMLEQMQLILGFSFDDVEDKVTYKLGRLEGRMERGERNYTAFTGRR